MKYMVSGQGWPLNGGATLIPASTIIDTALAQWSGVPYPPPDAIALDQATYNSMVNAYGYWRVLYGPGITPATSGGPSP